MNQQNDDQGLYLYAVVAASEDGPMGFDGLFDVPIHTLSDGVIAAVVSDVPASTRIRPERRQLAAHQRVLRALLERTTPLPITFGTVVPSAAEVHSFLAARAQMFAEALELVAGKVEMGLTISLSVPNIFEFFVNTHEELRDTRDRLLHLRQEPSHADKIEVGRMFDRCLQQDRERCTEKVLNLLAVRCADVRRNNPRNEREMLRLACLVVRTRLKQFEEGIFEAAKLFDNNFAFDFNGPWAPHNFVSLEKMG